ncbi:hypothetical protein LCGC14_0444260 [marine sediment metagenome]|uniref:HNH nuclease domain-containing protein n=1 Tax=marine sediment metagenome TaxID=412755 RepID=A0A0F9T2R6_9ZZZZ
MKDRKTPESYNSYNWDELVSNCIADETKVTFRGAPYYLRQKDRYYIGALPPPQLLLHRAIWTFCNGPIPPRHHIHHIDHNRQNNHPSNLKCMSISEHSKHHVPYRESKSTRSEKEDHVIIDLYAQLKSVIRVGMAVGRSQRFVWVVLNEHRITMDGFGGGSSPKLTVQQVSEIKVLLRKGSLMQQEIAREFNVSPSVISRIKTGNYTGQR